jgi:type II secretory pathway pseudopilin PulG
MKSRKRAMSRRSAFTLVEVMILVSIIGMLAVIAIPHARRAKRRSEDAAFTKVIRLLVGHTFELYAYENGDFPPDAAPGVQPQGIGSLLPRRFHWDRITDIGGHWDWDRAPTRGSKIDGYYAAVGVHLPRRTSVQMRRIDAAFDDGDLDTGIFRSKADGYVHVVEW